MRNLIKRTEENYASFVCRIRYNFYKEWKMKLALITVDEFMKIQKKSLSKFEDENYNKTGDKNGV